MPLSIAWNYLHFSGDGLKYGRYFYPHPLFIYISLNKRKTLIWKYLCFCTCLYLSEEFIIWICSSDIFVVFNNSWYNWLRPPNMCKMKKIQKSHKKTFTAKKKSVLISRESWLPTMKIHNIYIIMQWLFQQVGTVKRYNSYWILNELVEAPRPFDLSL